MHLVVFTIEIILPFFGVGVILSLEGHTWMDISNFANSEKKCGSICLVTSYDCVIQHNPAMSLYARCNVRK